jgi:hypothetical protein
MMPAKVWRALEHLKRASAICLHIFDCTAAYQTSLLCKAGIVHSFFVDGVMGDVFFRQVVMREAGKCNMLELPFEYDLLKDQFSLV